MEKATCTSHRPVSFRKILMAHVTKANQSGVLYLFSKVLGVVPSCFASWWAGAQPSPWSSLWWLWTSWTSWTSSAAAASSSLASSSQTIFRVGQRHQEFLGLIVYGQIFATCPVNSALQRAETSANFNCKSSFAAQVRACIGWSNIHSGKLMVLPSKKWRFVVSRLVYPSVMHIIQAWWAGWLALVMTFLCTRHCQHMSTFCNRSVIPEDL